MNGAELAARIDGAFLRLEAQSSVAALHAAVEEAQSYGLRSLCVLPQLVSTVKRNFPALRVSAVVSYPLGADTLAAKQQIALELIALGVDELDIVYDLFAILNDNRRKIELEARELGELTASRALFHKAIIETPILTPAQVALASHALAESAVDCIKTSTGYHREKTTAEHVRLIRSVAGQRKQIKASGGIRTLADARAMLSAGADILGTSSAAAIIDEARALAARR